MPPHRLIYLDHCATTPVDPRVFEAMRPYFTEIYGNAASSTHAFGWEADRAVIAARNQVAALLGAQSDNQIGAREIIFTSGATEANNLALRGVADAYRDKGRHIITQVTEHKAVIDVCKRLQQEGWEITFLDVDSGGRVSAAQVAKAIRPDTVLASIMWANNETGVVQPIREIATACHDQGVLFHTDATQAVGKLPIDVETDHSDLLSLSAHKFYGPKGAGALFVRRKDPRVRLTPLFEGGGHERGFRSGTLNVPGIVGLGAAAALATTDMASESQRQAALRDRLERRLVEQLGSNVVQINGGSSPRLPNVSNLSFAGVDGNHLLLKLAEELAVSTGSACSSGSADSSYVLKAMGISDDLAQTAVRISLGRQTTDAQMDRTIEKIVATVR